MALPHPSPEPRRMQPRPARSGRGTTLSFPIQRFRRLRFGDGLFCPRCGHTRIHRWGQHGWRRRYRCLGCRRTFSDFTGTPLAYLKRVELWPHFCRLALDVPTVRVSARALGIDPGTSFRWRHRLLGSLCRTETTQLGDLVSIHIDWFARSLKGSRSLDRPPRRVAFFGLSFQTDPVWVILGCDDGGRSLGSRLHTPRPVLSSVRARLEGRILPGSTLLSRQGWAGLVARAAGTMELPFAREPVSPEHLEPARLYAVRLRTWMGRFYGVATRYLDNYLVWFRLIDYGSRRLTAAPSASVLLLGDFP